MNTFRSSAFLLGISLLAIPVHQTFGEWETPFTISDPAKNSRSPRVEMDPLGNVFVIFTVSSSEWVANSPPGGSFSSPHLGPVPGSWTGARYAFEPSGNGLLAWNAFSGDVMVTERAAGATDVYGATQVITTETPPGYELYGHFIDINASGEAVLTYYEKRPSPGIGRQLFVATRPPGPGSVFGEGELLSINNPNSFGGQNVFIDPDGSVTVVWLEENGPSKLKQARREAGATEFFITTIAHDVQVSGAAPNATASGNGHALFT